MQPFPVSTVLGRAITKAKFYDKMAVSPSVKRAFVEQVEGIVWRNKLSAKTLNVQARWVTHSQLSAKSQSASDSLLHAIDNGVPHHILFLLRYDALWQAAIGYKEIGKASITLAVKEYYRTPWLPIDHIHLLISGMTMDEVFDNFVRQINTSLPAESTQPLRNDLENQAKRESIQHRIDVLYKRMRSEKQNHKVFALHQEIMALKAQLTEE